MTENEPATLVMAASTRTQSINAALARLIVNTLQARGEPAHLIDLTDFEMPMYHGDLEDDLGAPTSARDLVQLFAGATRLVIVSPEYNGAWPPLLKNTIDWMTRVDRGFMRHMTVHLAAASPGGLGGRRVLVILRAWMVNLRVDVADAELSVPNASIDEQLEFVADGDVDIDAFLPPALGTISS